MIYSLRKRHRYMWLILSVLLPVGFVAAVMVIPEQPIESNFKSLQPTKYSKLISTAENEAFSVRFLMDDNLPGSQIEVTVKKPIKTANAVVYFSQISADDVRNAGVLGQLNDLGVYRFPLGNSAYRMKEFHLLFYDSLKGIVFDKIKITVN